MKELLKTRLEQTTSFQMKESYQQASRFADPLTEQEQAVQANISQIVQENHAILMADMTKIQADPQKMDELTKQSLENLNAKSKNAGFKERMAISKEKRMLKKGHVEEYRDLLQSRIDKELDSVAQEGNEDNLEQDVHKEQIFTMKAALASKYTVSEKDRQNLSSKLNALSTSSETLHKQISTTQSAALRIADQSPDGAVSKYLRKRHHAHEKEAKFLDKKTKELGKTMESQVTTSVPQSAIDRYRDRVDHYKEWNKVSQKDAEEAIIMRAGKPVTMERVKTALQRYRENKNTRAVEKSVRQRGAQVGMEIIPYNEQVNDVLMYIKRTENVSLTQSDAEKFVKKYLTDLIQENQYSFRCSSTVFGLFSDDKMKNQLETGTSGGADNAGLRQDITSTFFAMESGELSSSEHENYGYLSSKKLDYANNTNTGGYGQIQVNLRKDAMQGRVTCTYGDSMNHMANCTSSSAEDPDFASVGYQSKAAVLIAAINYQFSSTSMEITSALRSSEQSQFGSGYKKAEYLELQYHGDVTIADVESVTVPIPAISVKKGETDAEAIARVDAQYKIDKVVMQAKIDEINNNAEAYGRAGLPPLKLQIQDLGDSAKYFT